MADQALPHDRLAWKDFDAEIDGKLWECVLVRKDARMSLARAHIGQNRWRTVSCFHGQDERWQWDHSR